MATFSDGWSSDVPKRSENAVGAALFDLILNVPGTDEVMSLQPAARAASLAQSAARRAAATSGALALPPGPLGLLTIVPDLVAIWKIQQQMVVDIAATYGRRAQLRREVMVYCLFKHGSAALVRDLVARVGERLLLREASLRVVQQLLRKIGVKVTQQVIGRSLTRWIPLVGAVGTGAYAYYDTKQVSATAIAYFSQPLDRPEPPLLSAGPPALPTLPPALPESASVDRPSSSP